MNPIIVKTKEYIERFNKYGFPETAEKTSNKALDLRRILTVQNDKFSYFEIAQILDLLPQTSAEAFSLIPSLKEKYIFNIIVLLYIDYLIQKCKIIWINYKLWLHSQWILLINIIK